MAQQPHGDEVALKIEEPLGSGTLPSALANNLANSTLPPPAHCVICLDHITEAAIALPCRHDQFDFPCLGTWLQRQQVCPLCKGEVKAIKFNVGERDKGGSKIFHLPPPDNPAAGRAGSHTGSTAIRQRRPRQGRGFRRGGRYSAYGRPVEDSKDTALEFRRDVYRNRLYSLHVGTNRISRYRNLTPASFTKDERLTSRARMWIRRELQVFDFLNPDSASSSSSSSSSSSTSTDRRASNADFLLEYIIAILKSIDLKGSAGQAEELLKDFLGRDYAKLFLHELEAWLRSPYAHLTDWDRAVQYASPQGADANAFRNGAEIGTNICLRRGDSGSSTSVPSVPHWFSDSFVIGTEGSRSEPS